MNSTVYAGLFLIGFALYASSAPQGQKTLPLAPVLENASSAPVFEEVETREKLNCSKKCSALLLKLQSDELFQKKIDGLQVEAVGNSVWIHVVSDELFESGSFSPRESWISILGRIATLLKPEQKKGLQIKIHAATQIGQANEKKSTEFGESDFSLATARAEWVTRYLEREWQFVIKQSVLIVGHPAQAQGKKIEFELSY